MRIGELSRQTGLPVRSIRYYHQLGLLPRPEMRGRVGWYGRSHVDRITLIRRLQDRGYSLAAVADMIDAQIPTILFDDVDRSDPVTAAWDGGDPHRMTRTLLASMVPQVVDEPALVQAMVDRGLLVPEGEDGETFAVPHPVLLRAGIGLTARGVPVATALGELDRLQDDLGAVAGRFAEILERDMLPPHLADGRPPVEAALELLQQVWPSVLVAVGTMLTTEMQKSVLMRMLQAEAAGAAGAADPAQP
jgi:hypothetical protein